MKRNPITIATGAVLALIFLFMLFIFQVRQTEVAVVTTFGKYSRSITNAGFQVRLPWPVQKVYKFDSRIQDFERKFDQTITRDQISVVITVYIGWRIVEPKVFLESFSGDNTKAEQTLEPLVRNAKSGVIGQHAFSDLISTNQAELKFDLVESEMLKAIQAQARSAYGIQVELLGIKRLQLPESITTDVFARMKAERQKLVARFQTEGEREAKIIKASADGQANEILAKAKAEAIRITGEAETKAAGYYAVFEKYPELAVFLFQLKTLEQSLKERTHLILDQQTPPFNLLSGQGAGAASGTGSKK
jgi:membrane protease subunit HflC